MSDVDGKKILSDLGLSDKTEDGFKKEKKKDNKEKKDPNTLNKHIVDEFNDDM